MRGDTFRGRLSPVQTPPVIGLSGPAGAGKDAVANILADWGYKRTAFADELRLEVGRILARLDPIPDGVSDSLRALLVARMGDVAGPWFKPTDKAMRLILQQYGTDFRRAQDPDYWVKKWWETAGPSRTVITDVRFENEAALMRELGQLWWVVRPGAGLQDETGQHISEQLWRTWEPDRIVTNYGTLEDLPGLVGLCLGVNHG